MQGHEELYSIYVHTSPSFVGPAGEAAGAYGRLFAPHIIRSEPVCPVTPCASAVSCFREKALLSSPKICSPFTCCPFCNVLPQPGCRALCLLACLS